MLTDDERELLDSLDPRIVRQIFIDALREDDGANVRAIQKMLQASSWGSHVPRLPLWAFETCALSPRRRGVARVRY
jgi:hypothetical protein